MPLGGYEGGPKAGVEVEDVSKVGTRAIRKDQDTGTVADYHPQGDQGSYGKDYTSPLDNPLVADLGDEIAGPGTRTTVGTTGTEGTVKDPGKQEGAGRRERNVARRAHKQEQQPYIPPPIDRVMPGSGPSTGGPPAGGDPLATRTGTGAGSGFYGEQKWFDPNAAAPATRDIGGFNPHELPRTAADFTAAGDAGGAGLLDRMNAPAPPVEDYLAPQGAAEGGLINQVPPEIIQQVSMAAQQLESPGAQKIIREAIEMLGADFVDQIITMAQQQGPMWMGQPQMDRGGLINGGGGDAMADDILVNAEMGKNGERQPIAVSAGEYIIPGDVVGHLGSGHTQGGANVLDQFVEDVRVERTGAPEQPGPIDLRDVLPGTYGERYA